MPDYAFGRGDADAALAGAPQRLDGAVPRSAGRSISISRGRSPSPFPARTATCIVHSSTQHPTEVQHVVARVLGMPDDAVTCETRRMGGGFGGKESQATQWAAIAALARARDRAAVQGPPRPRRRFHA